MDAPGPRIVESNLCSPRGVTSAYVLRGVVESPGGTKKEIRAQYKVTSLTLLRELETVDRTKMTAVCAKNDLSYKSGPCPWRISSRGSGPSSWRGAEGSSKLPGRGGLSGRGQRPELALVAAVVGM